MRDVIVVGSGPSGSYSSHLLSRMGYDVLNLEEHKEVGRPVECTGLVSERVISMARTKAPVNSVYGAHVHFPNGESVHVRKGEKTVVMDRDQFDKDVSAMAISSGTDVEINSRAVSVTPGSEYATVKYRQDGVLKEERARIVIGADGINSKVRKDVFGSVPSRVVSCYQVDSAVRMDDQESVSVFVGSRVTRGFFAWATPAGDITKIGVGSVGSSAKNYFTNFNSMFPKDRILGINGGGIPITYLKRTYAPRTLLVGDAAGIVKPLSGGGIYTGMISAKHAAEAAGSALENNDFSARFLARYQKSWKKDLGRELWIDGIIQRLFASVNDETFNRIYRMISRPSAIKIIDSVGDIDYPSRVVLSLMIRKPGLFFSLMGGK
ncbi:MAG: NAD(P)/FAD-dependent oxidoreductase [Candidatus Thermoplasmatota archaeon]|nr:NAD(P)/FAD-dependent oxidoreductase [Candidatus Thermoplasmatota archaeon]